MDRTLRHVDTESPLRLRDAPARGLSRGLLRGSGWQRLSQGLFGPAGLADGPPMTAALSLVLPSASGFGHLTAARHRGWWLPNRLGPHVTFAGTTSRVHVQRQGMYVRRSNYAEFEEVAGVAVTTAAQTLVELARDLSLIDLVAMADCALAAGADAEEILAAARPRVVGAPKLRRAVRLADPRSESWWETILRLVHVLPGLGPVQSQVELWDDEGFVARADLHLVGTRRYPECDGGQHREIERHRADLARDKRLSRQTLERYGYSTQEIARLPGMIIKDAEAARGLRHDPVRERIWWRFARDSTLTGHGRARLAARLERYRLAAIRR